MAGVKRVHEEMEEQTQNTGAEAQSIVSTFEHFRSEIDKHHERRERVIKVSRDITAFSKKIIFALQRIKHIGQPLSDGKVTKQVSDLKEQILKAFESIAGDLQSIDKYRYQRQISGGVQEWMEAILFEHYLVNQAIMPYNEAQDTIPSGIELTYEDYILGLFDMTGELMKISITSIATNGKLPGRTGGASVLTDMQIMRSSMELVDAGGGPFGKDFEQKLKTTRQSVEKVENSVYSMAVRGNERPKGWNPDHEGPRQTDEIESY